MCLTFSANVGHYMALIEAYRGLDRVTEHPKITQYSRSPSTRSLSVKQESPDSVHDMIDVAHAYIHHAVDQMYQSPPPLMNKPENLQNTKAMHAHQSNPTKSQSAMR